MSEPFTERLSRFTPASTGIDRDAWLFAAGRASARPGRLWLALAATLAVSQTLTLVLLWPRPAPAPLVEVTVPPREAQATRDGTPLWQLRDQAIVSDGNLAPSAGSDDLVPSDPPLHAFGEFPPGLIN